MSHILHMFVHKEHIKKSHQNIKVDVCPNLTLNEKSHEVGFCKSQPRSHGCGLYPRFYKFVQRCKVTRSTWKYNMYSIPS